MERIERMRQVMTREMSKLKRAGESPAGPLTTVLMVVLLIAVLFGCSGQNEAGNLIPNGDFLAWNDETGLPISWRVEGEGLSVRPQDAAADGSDSGERVVEVLFTDEVLFINSPFFFSEIKDPGAMAGKTVNVEVWVKTTQSGAVFLDVSDRAGHDFRSKSHTGGGGWERLRTSVQVAKGTATLECRVRFSHPARAELRGPYASNGWI